MQSSNCKLKISRGFSLVEVVFAAAIFAIVAMAIFQGFTSITLLISASRDKVVAADLINSEFELVRNLPYASVGLIGGIPSGVLLSTTTAVIDGRDFEVVRVIRNVDDPFDGTIGGAPNDLSPADYKLVEVKVVCNTCKHQVDFSAIAHVSPKNLETASTNGALFINVFDANGDPVPGASIQVTNSALGISINETTDNNGLLAIVDAPPAQNSYRIIATKSGFTTDRTYATSTGNPTPLKLDATVILQQVTPISFIIDKVSNINLHTTDNLCAGVGSVPFTVDGTKLIGNNPNVYKWTGNFTTDSSGFKNITNVEWDVFSFSVGVGHYLAGTNPISPISILPDSDQNIDLIMSSDPPAFLLVSVKDSGTGLPISGATASLSKTGYDESLITDQGFISQTDWSLGSGQLNFADPTRYSSSDGNIDINSPDGELKLANSFGTYVLAGNLTSSIFDTGTSSNWSRVNIEPTDQPPQTGAGSVKFQIATSPDNTVATTWDFLGPDGTASTFYTIIDNNINPLHDGDRYIRYKIFLSTLDPDFTPNVSDFAISFASSCIPPGQVLFSNLDTPNNYKLEVVAPGFTTQTINSLPINLPWQKQDILLSP